MRKTDLPRTLAILLVLTCGRIGVKGAEPVWYRILSLDFGRGHAAAETQPDFTPFMIADSGAEVDGIRITITSANMDSRWRGAPTGIPYELIYRDFIFFRSFRPGTVMPFPYTGPTEPAIVTLSGLVPNQEYEITIYSFDTSSAGNRVSDWTANGKFLFQIVMNQGNTPTSEYSNAYTEMAQADSAGKIEIVATIGAAQLADQAQYNQPFAFINGLEVYSTIPRYMALQPTPAIGATVSTSALQLQWTAGADAVKHDVYLGEVFDDVNAATTASARVFRGTTTVSSFDIAGLSLGKTYYWRVDEVKADGTVTKGYVWSFFAASLTAYNPSPVDGSQFADPNATLTWSAGAGATVHRVYFGDNLQQVQTGLRSTDKGAVVSASFTAGTLQRGKTYYWRIDEIAGTTTRTGAVWSFTTSPEGLGTIVCDLWEGITGSTLDQLTGHPNYPDNPTRRETLTSFSYGAANGVADSYGGRIHGWLHVPLTGDYTLYFTSADEGELWLSTDDDPENVRLLAFERTWGNFDVFSHKSDPVPLVGGSKYYIMAIWKEGSDWDHCQAAWLGAGVLGSAINPPLIAGHYLSPYEPTSAYGPRPRDGSRDVDPTPVLSWKSGVRASLHQVYFGTDQEAVRDANTSSPEYRGTKESGFERYDPGVLDWNTPCFWRIDEVNDLDTASPWIGEVWSLTTADFLVVDDFESYDDNLDTPTKIYDFWIDGWTNQNGSTASNWDPPFCEPTIVHGGFQSMPFDYNNTVPPFYSEAECEWTAPQDWTVKGVKDLTLYVRGNPAAYLEDAGVITMSGSGHDIWDAADDFRFAFKRLSGNGSIIAKVESLVNTNQWAKAGVMIRKSLDPGSEFAYLVMTPAQGVSFGWRRFPNEGCGSATQAGVVAPQWVKLTRAGDAFTAQYSADGKTWTDVKNTDGAVASTTVVMTGSIYVGLCVTSRDSLLTTTAVFSNITTSANVTGAWQVVAIGDDPQGGNSPQGLYVALEDVAGGFATAVNPDPRVVLATEWAEWKIPMSSFTGVDASRITKMYIGVGDKKDPQAVVRGRIYIDDIRVTKPSGGPPNAE